MNRPTPPNYKPINSNSKKVFEGIIFMLTRNKKINVKRMDLINHLQE